MLGKQNKHQLALKAQYLPILALAEVECVWFWCGFGTLLVMLQGLFFISKTMRGWHQFLSLALMFISSSQDRISGTWPYGKWHCLQLTEDGSHCHCLEPDC